MKEPPPVHLVPSQHAQWKNNEVDESSHGVGLPSTTTERDSSSSFSYHLAHTPRFSLTRGLRNSTSLAPGNNNNNLNNPVNSSELDHRERFLSDVERLLTADPVKTRESFCELELTNALTASVDWQHLPLDLALKKLQVTSRRGLDDQQVNQRRQEFGANVLEKETKTPLMVLFVLQFMNFIIGLLVAAALASIALQEFVEGFAIIAIVTLNAVIATFQERNASNALEALSKMTSPESMVLRDGQQVQVPSDQLVPGDIVLLRTGDIVPADCRLVTSCDLKVNEMILTGESEDVLKRHDAKLAVSNGPNQKLTAENMVFASTCVASGNATAVVIYTGMATRVGAIAALLKTEQANGKNKNFIAAFLDKYRPKMTPLQHTLHRLGVFMGTVVLGICVIVFIVGMVRANEDPKNPDRPIWLTMIMVSVSLAVSAVPEGLPMVVTICLSTGTAEMVKKNVLVRKLAAVESLGASSVICTDKTGTLTEGKMTAVKMWGNNKTYDITGVGFEPRGDILFGKTSQIKSNCLVRSSLLSAVLCSNTRLTQEQEPNGGPTMWKPMGNSSEAPLVVAAAKANIWEENVASVYPRVQEIPFSSDRKMMIVLNEMPTDGTGFENLILDDDTTHIANVKGAPNYILDKCTRFATEDGTIVDMRARDRAIALEHVDALSSQALRVLAIAIKPMNCIPSVCINSEDTEARFEVLSEDLIFLGLIASIDPPREGVTDSIRNARLASIRTIMITGDYLKTAVAIAKEIDIISSDAQCLDLEAVDCNVLRPNNGKYLPDAELDEIISQCSVFARAKPEDKIEIVKSLQRQGHVAAMTGDGVNDAPALKEADIGVSMGLAGTAVAKGASDMVLTDDNFCSIVSAVEKGREIYANIQKFVCFLLSTNFGEITVIFTAIAIGLPNPLEPLQILVLNLFADGMAAVALSLEKGEPGIMNDRPRPRDQSIIHGRLWVIVLSNAALIGFGALSVFCIGLYWNFGDLLLETITADAQKGDSSLHVFHNVVCKRWEGTGNGWKMYGNCDAKLKDGTFKFGSAIGYYNGLEYSDDQVYCRTDSYDCVSEGIASAQTMAFVYITMMEMFRAYTARSFTNHVFHNFLTNKWMQLAAIGSITLTISVTNIPFVNSKIFGFESLTWYEWMLSIATAVVMVFVGEMVKRGFRRHDQKFAALQKMQEGFDSVLVEIRNLRHHVEFLESKLDEARKQKHEAKHKEERLSTPTSQTSSSSRESIESFA